MNLKEEGIMGIIFDVDGTMIGTNLNLPKGIFREILSATGDGVYNEEKIPYFWFGGDGITRQDILKKEFHVQDTNRFWKYWDSLASNKDYVMQFKSLYRDVEEAIEALRSQGYPLAIVTDPPGKVAMPQIEKFLHKEYFNPIVTLSDTPGLSSKPDPQGLLYCAKFMGLPLDQLVYVGDATNDLWATKNVRRVTGKNMRFIWMNRGEHPIYIEPEREINSLLELAS